MSRHCNITPPSSSSLVVRSAFVGSTRRGWSCSETVAGLGDPVPYLLARTCKERKDPHGEGLECSSPMQQEPSYLMITTYSGRLLRRACSDAPAPTRNDGITFHHHSAAQLIRVVQAQGSNTTTDSPAQAPRASAPSRFDSGALRTNSNHQSSTAIRRPPRLHPLRQHAEAHQNRPCSPSYFIV